MKDSIKLIFAVFVLGFVGLLFPLLEEINFQFNGVVCNYSSDSIWLTVTESGVMQAYMLNPHSCTHPLSQDAEAIWGRDCSSDPCQYQAWKLGAGIFEVSDDRSSSSGFRLRIWGLGAGSRWHITWEWPRPDLSEIRYSLVR